MVGYKSLRENTGLDMENLDDYCNLIKSCSEEELEGILRNIDREKYKDRYKLVIEELKKREEEFSKKPQSEKGPIEIKSYPPWSIDTVLEIVVGVFFLTFIFDLFGGVIIVSVIRGLCNEKYVAYSIYKVLRIFVIDGLIFYVICRFLKYYKLSFKDGLCLRKISAEKASWLVIGGVFMGFCNILLGLFRSVIPEISIEEKTLAIPGFLLFVLLAISLGPVVEEMFYRGYVYPAIERSRGMAQAIILTTLAFWIVHIPQLWGKLSSMVFILIGSFIITLIRAYTKSTTASIIFHIAYNISICIFAISKVFFG